MALEDIAMFRAIPGSTVFYPSDAVSCERAVELAANTKGICFIRSSRPATPVIYGANEPFQVGKAKVCTYARPARVHCVAVWAYCYGQSVAVVWKTKKGRQINCVMRASCFSLAYVDHARLVGATLTHLDAHFRSSRYQCHARRVIKC